jgi:uncharacterized OB-fold protein
MAGGGGVIGEPLGAFPLVERDRASGAFFDAAARGELLARRSTATGTIFGPEVGTDPETGTAEFAPVVVSGEGTLISWVVVHQAPTPSLAAAVPYVSAVVELTEGPWLLVRLIDVEPATLSAEARVRARFVRSGTSDESGEVLPVFCPV